MKRASHFQGEDFNGNSILANGKCFIAHKIINRLENSGGTELLKQLEALVTDREKGKRQLDKVCKDSFDAKPIFSQKCLVQKINDIYYNPVSGKWKLEESYIEYEHSNASFYELQLANHFRPRGLIPNKSPRNENPTVTKNSVRFSS